MKAITKFNMTLINQISESVDISCGGSQLILTRAPLYCTSKLHSRTEGVMQESKCVLMMKGQI